MARIALTGKRVENDLYELCKGSELAQALTGGVYLAGARPRGSKLEDAVVVFVAGIDGLPQRGVAEVLVYVPDIPHDGVMAEDSRRTYELSEAAAGFVRAIAGARGYHWTLDGAIHTEDCPDIDQHVVVVKLEYKYL